jgi:hypothetical protein
MLNNPLTGEPDTSDTWMQVYGRYNKDCGDRTCKMRDVAHSDKIEMKKG